MKQMKGVEFFFSSVSSLEQRCKEKKNEDTQHQEDVKSDITEGKG